MSVGCCVGSTLFLLLGMMLLEIDKVGIISEVIESMTVTFDSSFLFINGYCTKNRQQATGNITRHITIIHTCNASA